jgi:hypothetical protein
LSLSSSLGVNNGLQSIGQNVVSHDSWFIKFNKF